MSGKLSATNENLWNYAHKPLMRWLVQEALLQSKTYYVQAKERLERDENFATIFPTRMGWAVGSLMDRLAEEDRAAPLINVLMVSSKNGLPSRGAGEHYARRYGLTRLKAENAPKLYPNEWRRAFERAVEDVYAYKLGDWADLFQRAFDEPLGLGDPLEIERESTRGTEKDGIQYGRHGEGPNHKALRLWVEANPGELHPSYSGARAATEVDLASADRVDVVFYCRNKTVVVEVKSHDSNEADHLRGVYQCIKYRAVQTAMDARGVPDERGVPREFGKPVVEAVLVTEEPPSPYIADLLRLYRIKHILVPMDRS